MSVDRQSDLLKEHPMDCKNCRDREFCYNAPTKWTGADHKEYAQTFLRILRCKSDFTHSNGK